MSEINQPGEESGEFKRIVELLDFEITRIRAEESQPGWTVWALLGGIATTGWLFTLEIESHGANLRAISFLFLIFYLVFTSTRVLHRLLSPPSSSLKSASHFHLSHSHLSKTRTSLLLDLALRIILILIVVAHSPLVHPAFYITACILFGAEVVVCLIIFALSFLHLPITDYRTSRLRQVAPFIYIFFALIIITLVGYGGALVGRTISPTISEYRSAGLLMAITLMLSILARRGRDSPLLQTLIDIRRNIGFGRLPVEDAKRQAEIALEGMTASDILQDELAAILSHIEDINIRLESAAKEVQAFTTTLPKGAGGLSDDQRTLLMAVRQSVDAHLSHVNEIQAKLFERMNKLRRRASIILGLSPEALHTMMPVGSSVDAAMRSIEVRRQQLREQINVLDERFRSSDSNLSVPAT